MFQDLILQFATLAGVAALIAALVNVFKVFGLPDGNAPQVSSALSLIAFIALASFRVFAPEVSIEGLDAKAQDIAGLILYVLGFFVQMGLPAKFHGWLAESNVPVLGKSYSRTISG